MTTPQTGTMMMKGARAAAAVPQDHEDVMKRMRQKKRDAGMSSLISAALLILCSLLMLRLPRSPSFPRTQVP